MDKFLEHARTSGAEVISDKIVSVTGSVGNFEVTTGLGKIFQTKTILIAT
jgi:thioredoxin reductase